MKKIILIILLLVSFVFYNCSEKKEKISISKLELKMNKIATEYVRLALEIGMFDKNFIDAYYGPDSLKPQSKDLIFSQTVFEHLDKKTNSLLDELESLSDFPANELERLRYNFLYKQLLACKTKIYLLNGMNLTFDEELKSLYDIEIDYKDEKYFDSELAKLDNILPGKGSIYERYISFRNKFQVPESKVQEIFEFAIKECRRRTNDFIKLPPNERFELKLVKGQTWSAYNWFKGNSFSLIEINTDLPIYVERDVDLAAHEGYPGHHVHHTMMEWNIYKRRNWIEFSVYLLFSPQSVIAEGIASYAPEILFTEDERIQFEKEFIFPLAGLDTSQVELYYEVMSIINKLNYSLNNSAKNYLDGNWSEKRTIDWIKKYNLKTEDSAKKFLDFIKTYRSYVVNYSAGYDLIKYIIEEKNSKSDWWKVLNQIISSPLLPSTLERISDVSKN